MSSRASKAATPAPQGGLNEGGFTATELEHLPEAWSTMPLGHLCRPPEGFIQTGPFGSQLHASDYVADGVPIVNPTHLDGNRVRHEQVPLVTEADAKRLERHRLSVGDILFSRRGDVGRHAHVSDKESGWLCGTGCLLVRPTPDTVDSLYLSYFLSARHVQDYLASHAVGSIMPNINTKILDAVPVLIPPLPEQRAIAAVLSKIQAAVEVQDKIVATLKELKAATMAKLFREGLRGEPLKQTEIGEIPESWEVICIGDAAAIAEGQVDPKVEPYASMLNIGPEDVEPETGRLLECRTARAAGLISGKYLFHPGDIVYSKIRPYLRKAVLVDFTGLCSADMYPLTPSGEFHAQYLQNLLVSEVFTRQAVAEQDRTGIPKVNRQQLNRVLIPRPPLSEQRAIGELLTLIGRRASTAIGRRDSLKSVFASILHLLMTGRVRVNGCSAPFPRS